MRRRTRGSASTHRSHLTPPSGKVFTYYSGLAHHRHDHHLGKKPSARQQADSSATATAVAPRMRGKKGKAADEDVASFEDIPAMDYTHSNGFYRCNKPGW